MSIAASWCKLLDPSHRVLLLLARISFCARTKLPATSASNRLHGLDVSGLVYSSAYPKRLNKLCSMQFETCPNTKMII
jgi:hypothetical protein